MTGRGRIVLGVVAAAVLACADGGCARRRRETAGEPRAAVRPPPALSDVDIVEHLGSGVPRELTFTDPTGAGVRLGELLDGKRPLVLVLAYFRCPMLCDLVQQGLAGALRGSGLRPGRDVRAVTISIDPKDTSGNARLRQNGLLTALGGAMPAPPGAWRVLTGREPQIRALAEALGFRYVFDPGSGQYAHPACAFVLTPDGRISRYLYGTTFRPFDLRLAAVEATAGRIGNVVDRVLLTCFRYDPSARKYGVYVVGVMRGGSALVLLLFSVGMMALLRRDRARGGARRRS
jgi:protein SCO1/2